MGVISARDELHRIGIHWEEQLKHWYLKYRSSGNKMVLNLPIIQVLLESLPELKQSKYWDDSLSYPLKLSLQYIIEVITKKGNETLVQAIDKALSLKNNWTKYNINFLSSRNATLALAELNYLISKEIRIKGHVCIDDDLNLHFFKSEFLTEDFTLPFVGNALFRLDVVQSSLLNELIQDGDNIKEKEEEMPLVMMVPDGGGVAEWTEYQPGVVEPEPSLSSKLMATTYTNTKFGVKLKLVSKANRSLVSRASAQIGIQNSQIKSLLLALGPTGLLILSEYIKDKDISPFLKSMISEAADLGQIDAAGEITQEAILLFGNFVYSVTSNYVKAVGGDQAVKLLTQDIVVGALVTQFGVNLDKAKAT